MFDRGRLERSGSGEGRTPGQLLAEARRQTAKQARFVQLGRSEGGIRTTMIVRARQGDLIMVYALVDRLADILGLGAAPNPPPNGGPPRSDCSRSRPWCCRCCSATPATASPPARTGLRRRRARPSREPAEPGETAETAETAVSRVTATTRAQPPARPSQEGRGIDHVNRCRRPRRGRPRTSTSHPTRLPSTRSGSRTGGTNATDTGPRRNLLLRSGSPIRPSPDPRDPHAPYPPVSGVRLDLPGLANLLTEQGLRAARPRVVLNVHLTDTTLRTGSGVVRTEGCGPMLAAQLRRHLADPDGCGSALSPVVGGEV
jgi:hypothetical protein